MRDFMFGAKKKKNTKKIRQVSWSRISGTAGAIPFKLAVYPANCVTSFTRVHSDALERLCLALTIAVQYHLFSNELLYII